MWVLTLKNFSYHKEARFEINENAITLFSGESGSGKTTIFRALAYAFFGSRIRSIASFDKKSCTVTLEMNDKKTRTKRVFMVGGPSHHPMCKPPLSEKSAPVA